MITTWNRRLRLIYVLPYVAPLALILGPFLLWPLVAGLMLTFTNVGPFQVEPRFIGLNNYVNALADGAFRNALINMVVFTGASVTLAIVLGLLIALALRRPFRGRALFRTALLLPWLLSPAASGVMWHQLLNNQRGMLAYWALLLKLPPPAYALGLDTSYGTVILTEIWRKTPLAAFLLLPALRAIPVAAWDQARLEAVPFLSQIRHIVIPRLHLVVWTVALLLAGDTLGISESVYFLTGGGPGTRTTTPGLYAYNQAIIALNWSAGGTPGWFIAGAVLILGIVYYRVIYQGILPVPRDARAR